MLGNITSKLTRIKRNLFYLDEQSIGKASLSVIIFLDLFILISIFNGLDDHTRQLTRPDQLVPQFCRDIIIDEDWNKTNQLTRLARVVSNARSYYYYRDERERTHERHAVCEPISKLFLSIEDDRSVASNLKDFLGAKTEIKDLTSELGRTKGAYDTSLLERIADKKVQQTNVDSLKKEISEKTGSLNELLRKQKLLESSLQQDNRIQKLFFIVENISEEQKIALRDDLRELNFWFPVKRLGMEMLFLLPLLFVFYLWNSKSISSNRPFQTLVSSHLLVIAFIPVFFKILDLIYDIIPKKLLKHIMELLESLNLVAIWHYLLMAVSILVALAVIHLFQNKLFSREKVIEKLIAKGSCQSCSKHLPPNISSCPFCGFEQFKECSHCNKPTYVYGKFCKECGVKNE